MKYIVDYSFVPAHIVPVYPTTTPPPETLFHYFLSVPCHLQSLLLPITLPFTCHHHSHLVIATHDPLHEQLLMRLVVAGVLFIILIGA